MMNHRDLQLPLGAQFVIKLVAGREAGRILKSINQWMKESGPEWTVSRLKAYRVAALQLRAGNPGKAKAIYQENSIAYYHGTLLPRGPMGTVVERFVSSQKPQTIKAWDAVLRAYTSIRLSTASEAQIRKAKQSICSPFTGDPRLRDEVTKVAFQFGQVIKSFMKEMPNPCVSRLKMFTSTYQVGAEALSETKKMPYGKFIASLATAGKWPENVASEHSRALRARGIWDNLPDLHQELEDEGLLDPDSSTGKITVLQEAGAKARVVAQPNGWYQLYFQPLHSVLHDLQRWWQESVVDDQVNGAYWLRSCLDGETTAWSFDLSSATDRFPREPQLALLKGLGLESYADDLEAACRDWVGPDGTIWNYAVGQPMGLYGSFPLFHLTHLALLVGCCQIHGVLDKFPFRVLGDDVVITDKRVAKSYHQSMKGLGVVLSPAKTISSKDVAEFAGFICTRTNRSVTAYRPYKHGPTGDLHAPVNLIANLGSRVRGISPTWARYFEQYQRTRQWRHLDLSPLLASPAEEGVLPPVLDTTRLAHLMTQVFTQLGWEPEVMGSSGFQAERVLASQGYRLEKYASQLLDKQLEGWDSPQGERELLRTPLVEDDKYDPTPQMRIQDDPLMGTPPAWTRNHYEILDVEEEDAEEIRETNSPRTGLSLLDLKFD